MANAGCIDMNAWYSRADRPERPGLRALRPRPVGGERLPRGRAGSPCWCARPWELVGPAQLPQDGRARAGHARDGAHRGRSTPTRDVRAFWGGGVARCARGHPPGPGDHASGPKAPRRGVLIDANQIGYGKTISSVYSVRPRPGAPVSTPLRWEEVSEGPRPAGGLTMPVVLERRRPPRRPVRPRAGGRAGARAGAGPPAGGRRG